MHTCMTFYIIRPHNGDIAGCPVLARADRYITRLLDEANNATFPAIIKGMFLQIHPFNNPAKTMTPKCYVS